MKISVCIAAYNGGRFIWEQVMSILPQLGEDDEIIVSDDGSIDDTINILNSFHDKRIKIFINEGRHGVVPNFENALKHSSGDYIFFSDQDIIRGSCLMEAVFLITTSFKGGILVPGIGRIFLKTLL